MRGLRETWLRGASYSEHRVAGEAGELTHRDQDGANVEVDNGEYRHAQRHEQHAADHLQPEKLVLASPDRLREDAQRDGSGRMGQCGWIRGNQRT